MEFELIKCKDGSKGRTDKWFYMKNNCDWIDDLSDFTPTSFDMREIVFVAKMPHKRDGVELQYSPSFQFILGLLQVDVEYHKQFKYVDHASLQLEVRMAYRDKGDKEDDWKLLVQSNVTRKLECTIEEEKKEPGNDYSCDMMDLFELGHSSHAFYLLNIRIPIDQAACRYNPNSPNCQIGLLKSLRVIEIHQNGGFTMVWLWMKTLLSPLILACLFWFWNRISQLVRRPLLLEKAIFSLGISMAVLDLPIEWISLVIRLPFLLLLSDIRQGLFYFVLFAFWLIFAGEHLIGDSTRNNIRSYKFNLGFIASASALLLVYDLIERGYQLSDPFYTIWSSEHGAKLAYTSISLALILTIAYFFFLFYKIGRVWMTIRSKREAHLYRTSENSRLKVEAVIYRFKFLMIFTLLCSALTICAYFMKQFGEAQLHSDEPEDSLLTHSTSAFFTGTFGMWNIYVVLLLAMYAPSHKQYQGTAALVDETEGLLDDPSVGSGTESNPMTTLLKQAHD
ncbi:hypothetical protein WR25_03748 [Diploscapter pachys]|uniref:Protein wntless n=1 Tax=Diploscapter pachys TaxID=2018661 RepID=A0A2A2LNG9_9BILA|nr:hypothetical protein WR25_03748 [Diploscapter pachys]